MGKLPKLNFPTFDWENIRLWISHAESYFEMYLLILLCGFTSQVCIALMPLPPGFSQSKPNSNTVIGLPFAQWFMNVLGVTSTSC